MKIFAIFVYAVLLLRHAVYRRLFLPLSETDRQTDRLLLQPSQSQY
jgi:hypothetical protein